MCSVFTLECWLRHFSRAERLNSVHALGGVAMAEKLHIISWSGGKDSTASVILAHEHGDPVDLIIMCVVWFDKARGIYGENPKHMAWVLDYAKPLFEAWGYKVVIITSEKDYIYHFHHIVKKSKLPERNGRMQGWLLGGMCRMNEEKVAPIRRYLKALKTDYEEYVGIATDEQERLASLKEKREKTSLLEKYGYTEAMAKDICEKYNLLSPTYKVAKRGGCWFCPNQGIKELADLKEHHADLWRELELLDAESNKVSEGFKYGKTFKQVTAEVENYLSNDGAQLSFEDYLQEVQL